jgi:hypothetical protein
VKHGAIAAANFEKTMRVRKELVYKADDEFVADDEPEMLRFNFRKCLEIFRIHSADGVGKIRREHRNAIALGDYMPAHGASPAGRPDPLIFGNRLYRTASKATPTGLDFAAHARRRPSAPSMCGCTIVRDFIIGRL